MADKVALCLNIFLACVARGIIFARVRVLAEKRLPPHSPHGFAAPLLRLPSRERSRRQRWHHFFPTYDQLKERVQLSGTNDIFVSEIFTISTRIGSRSSFSGHCCSTVKQPIKVIAVVVYPRAEMA